MWTNLLPAIDLNHGGTIQGWCYRRCRLTDNDRKLHCQSRTIRTCSAMGLTLSSTGQSCNRQAHTHPRPNLLLPIWISGGYSSHCRHGALQPADVYVRILKYVYVYTVTYIVQASGRRTTIGTHCSKYLQRVLLREQGWLVCRYHCWWLG